MFKSQWTDQTPSGFALPISGATFLGAGSGMATRVVVPAAPTSVARDRHVTGTAVLDAAPGSHAWSPPTG